MKNVKQSKKGIFFLFFIIFLILFFYFKNQKRKQIQIFFNQKPVNKVQLPHGCKLDIPVGFTVFQSKIKNITIYNFIKYISEWENNNFVKIDLTIINKKFLGMPLSKFIESNFDFDDAIIKHKLNLSKELKKLRENSGEEGQVYDIDYGLFKSQYLLNGKINNRIWRRYALQLYEPLEDGQTNIIKIWNNLYTVYKDYVFIIDYVCILGLKKEIANILKNILKA